jgi:hypothetical protein
MEIGAEYCACCEYSAGETKFNNLAFCDKCPIQQYTGEDDCNKTPYYAVIRGKASPTEMLDWLVELEAGGTPPILFNEPYRQ